MIRLFVVMSFVAAAMLSVTPDIQAGVQNNLAMFNGRPTFKEGSDRSYFVWRDNNNWHVRWTTLGEERRFTGLVRATAGKLTNLKRIDVDAELKVIRPGRPARVVRGPAGRARVAPGRRAVVGAKEEDHIQKEDDRLIRWTTLTIDDIDGFDFDVDGVLALTFDLKIEGLSRPTSVEVGRGNSNPGNNPFTVSLGLK